jgi:hypothetical protein
MFDEYGTVLAAKARMTKIFLGANL